MNTLYYGDNLKILREYIKDESVDLIYLDPPFNSNRNYNVLFRDEAGADSESQITAFEDTWHWNLAAEQTYNELISGNDQVGQMIESFRQFIGTNQMMAYLVMMAARLKELHRVLKPSGSLYLHCDPTASHYLKILLDTTFGPENFRNDITWKRTYAHGDSRRKFSNVSDTIFFYSRTKNYQFKVQYIPYSEEYIKKYYRHADSSGRRYQLVSLRSPNPRPNLTYDYKGYKPHQNGWAVSREKMEQLDSEGRLYFPSNPEGAIREKYYLDEMPGVVASDNWIDIEPISAHAQERLGYPTQKPVALLERIIKASSNEGDVVLDPFCGCGTTIAAAQKLGRKWIGIDVTHLSVGLQKLRLKDSFGLMPVTESQAKKLSPEEAEKHYVVVGQPEDLEGAKDLAERDKYGFQWWVLPLIGAKAYGSEAGKKEGKKGADRGVDGSIVFTDGSAKSQRVIVSVKGGHVNSAQIRDLIGTVEREKAAIGVFLTLEPPTKAMLTEAAEQGFYHSPGWNKDYPKIQILTVEDLLAGKTVSLPPNIDTFKKAEKISRVTDEQPDMFADSQNL